MTEFARLDAAAVTLILGVAKGASPRVIYWGRRLGGGGGDPVDATEIAALSFRQTVPGSADMFIEASLSMEPGLGLPAPSGFDAHRSGRDWASRFETGKVTITDQTITIIARDQRTRLGIEYAFAIDPQSGILTIDTALTNYGAAPLDLGYMATASLPVPAAMTDIIGMTGRWAGEFGVERTPRHAGSYVRENWCGRTSADSYPAIILCSADTTEASGEAYGVHLAWSGNHRVRVDSLNDGRVIMSAGALLYPGEVRVGAGESYKSPRIIAAYSDTGLTRLSQSFHAYVRNHILRPATRARPRPVHYNTWEAVYFDHDIDKLKALATHAAAIGVERFVLDDGWFGGRRSDRAGLGDWQVSRDVYSNGLKPLIDHVRSHGMTMGIWFEPEMVNADSDLYRAHPDWVLGVDGIDHVPSRHQFALDIARPDVSDYLFGAIDAVLRAHDIDYIKWDMNRDVTHPGGADGSARAYAYVTALYALIDRIRAAHPALEIESCSSGGARADMGILARTDRVWTSDTNDAIDRQAIQRGASLFLPLDVIGAHVGPRCCHITGRTLPMAMRSATALMGHMGLELDLLTESDADLAVLADAIALYKTHRALLHSSDFYRIDTPHHLNVFGVVAGGGGEALYSVGYLTSHRSTMPGALRFGGLARDQQYRLRMIWPVTRAMGDRETIVDRLDLRGAGTVISGDALMALGLELPVMPPETVLLFHLTADG